MKRVAPSPSAHVIPHDDELQNKLTARQQEQLAELE